MRWLKGLHDMRTNIRNEENKLNMLSSSATSRPVSIARELRLEINKVTFEGESKKPTLWKMAYHIFAL